MQAQFENQKNTTEKWSESEYTLMFKLQSELGNRWAEISKSLPQKSENAIKNKFYSTIRKGMRRLNAFVVQKRRQNIGKKSHLKQIEAIFLKKLTAIINDNYNGKLEVKPPAVALCREIQQQILKIAANDLFEQIPDTEIENTLLLIQQFNKNCRCRKGKQKLMRDQEFSHEDKIGKRRVHSKNPSLPKGRGKSTQEQDSPKNQPIRSGSESQIVQRIEQCIQLTKNKKFYQTNGNGQYFGTSLISKNIQNRQEITKNQLNETITMKQKFLANKNLVKTQPKQKMNFSQLKNSFSKPKPKISASYIQISSLFEEDQRKNLSNVLFQQNKMPYSQKRQENNSPFEPQFSFQPLWNESINRIPNIRQQSTDGSFKKVPTFSIFQNGSNPNDVISKSFVPNGYAPSSLTVNGLIIPNAHLPNEPFLNTLAANEAIQGTQNYLLTKYNSIQNGTKATILNESTSSNSPSQTVNAAPEQVSNAPFINSSQIFNLNNVHFSNMNLNNLTINDRNSLSMGYPNLPSEPRAYFNQIHPGIYPQHYVFGRNNINPLFQQMASKNWVAQTNGYIGKQFEQ